MRLWAALALLPGLALAQAPDQPPPPRPSLNIGLDPGLAQLRPMPKPFGAKVQEVLAAAQSPWPRPQPRPEGLTLVSAPQAPQKPQPQKPKATLKGAVCGIASLKGRALPPMRSTTKGCGMAKPVEVSSIAGVTLSPPATINCEEAAALAQWVPEALQPAFDGQVTGLQVADSYACRPRNNVRGNPVSVHGLGDAIDLSAVVLASGKTVAVSSKLDRRWQKARKAGCGTFTVTLGPGSDGYHESHIHLDVSDHGGGPYCK